MENLTCIIDAKSLVDNIQEIKKWIYRGQLHLIVTTDTSEAVQKLFEKSVEPKQTAQDAARPKSSGKAAKKEYPTFDINPKVAHEYLSRIKKGKEGEPVVKERPLYVAEEVQNALEFQKPTEEYSPWKNIPLEEEKPETPDDRPVSWADAARKKANAINGSADRAEGSKGPVKPKLVSKTFGSDGSPWKIQRNAPKISPHEVPVQVRQLMSYALWWIHESIHRNDSDQLFLLTEDPKIRGMAQKLNIFTRSIKDIRRAVALRGEEVDLNLYGDLERDGLAPKQDSPIKLEGGRLPEQSEVLDHAQTTDGPDGKDELSVDTNHEDLLPTSKDNDKPVNGLSANDHGAGESSEGQPSSHTNGTTKTAINPQDLVKSLLKSQPPEIRESATRDKDELGKPATTQLPSLVEIEEGKEAKIIHDAPDRVEIIPEAKPPQTPEDSDEEVVVFVPNPKRMSAQKKQAQANSRPTTSSGPAQEAAQKTTPPFTKGTQPELNTPSTKSAQLELKPAFQSPKQAKASPRSRPTSSGPTLIDPDAFGRNFAVNPDSSPHAHPPRPRSHHSPQPSSNHTQPSALNGGAASFQPRTSPQRHKDTNSPRRGAKPSSEVKDETKVPMISSQAFTRAQLVAPNTQSPKKSDLGPIAPPSKTPKRPSTQPVKDADFDRSQPPRRTQGTSVHQPRNGQPKPQKPSPRPAPNGHGSSQGQARIPKPTLFEPELDDTRAPPAPIAQSDSRTQDVQYVLKSGMTREASRGKGKLWVG